MGRLRTFFAAAILLSLSSAGIAAPRHQLNLPGGRLGDAIVALGRQAGISIGLSDPALASQAVPAVKGPLTVEQALRRLLKGKAARYIVIDPETIRIVRQPARRALPASVKRAKPPPRPLPAPVLPPPFEEEQEEIIVTAAKRQVPLSSYPGAVTIIDGDDAGLGYGIRGSEALVARLPSLSSTHLGPGRNKLFIRGMADSSFNGPTQAMVGQYLGETRLNYNSPDPDLRLHDLDRVEVLAGPQGTLYGAGSLAGVIRLVPNAPRLEVAEAQASIGASYTQHGQPGADISGILNIPLGPAVGVRLVGYGASEGGYIDVVGAQLPAPPAFEVFGEEQKADPDYVQRDINRTRVVGGRAMLRAELSPDWIIDLGLTGQHIQGEDAQYTSGDGPPLTRQSEIQQNFDNGYWLGSIVATKTWDDFRFVTSAGIVRHTLKERYAANLVELGILSGADGSGSLSVVDQTNRVSFFSAESRLFRQPLSGNGWVIGASFTANRFEQSRAEGIPEAPVPVIAVSHDINEGAIFGEVSLQLRPGFIVTGGGRLSYSSLSGSVPSVSPGSDLASALKAADQTEIMILPSAGVSVTPTSNLLLFLRYQEGFRPGGFVIFAPDEIEPYDDDAVTAVEAGLRYGQPGVGPFDAAISFAYTHWRDIQADSINRVGVPITTNIGDGRIYTIDAKLGWRPLPGLGLEAAAVFNDSLVTNPVPGIDYIPEAPLPNIARLNGRLGVEYLTSISRRLSLLLFTSGRYVGKSSLGTGHVLGKEQGDWFDVSLGLRAKTHRHAFSLEITNLLDTVGNRFAVGSPYILDATDQRTPLRPRTVRLGWELRF